MQDLMWQKCMKKQKNVSIIGFGIQMKLPLGNGQDIGNVINVDYLEFKIIKDEKRNKRHKKIEKID